MSPELDRFVEQQGRRPRALLACEAATEAVKARQAQLSVKLADGGFDVDVAPDGGEAADIVRQAVENDVDAVVLLAAGVMMTALDQALARGNVDHVLRVQALEGMMMPSDAADLVLAAEEEDPAAALLEYLL